MKNNEILVIIGFSGSGKDTIANAFHELFDYSFVVSESTRPMRPGESEGHPYNFKTKEEFSKGDYIEVRNYNTLVGGLPEVWSYGVLKSAIKPNQKYVVVLDWSGYLDFKKVFPKRLVPVFLRASEIIRRKRSENRGGFDIAEWNRRYADDHNIFNRSKYEIEKECLVVDSLNALTTVIEIARHLNSVTADA